MSCSDDINENKNHKCSENLSTRSNFTEITSFTNFTINQPFYIYNGGNVCYDKYWHIIGFVKLTKHGYKLTLK